MGFTEVTELRVLVSPIKLETLGKQIPTGSNK